MVVAILIFSVLIGAGLACYLNHIKHLSQLLLTFSGSFLLTATILEIFPTLYHGGTPYIGLFILLGVFLQILLEAITKGAEHGHFHHHNNGIFPFSIFVGLMVHALIEGAPLKHDINHHLLITIAIHKVPVAIVLTGFILTLTEKSVNRIILILIFALASPLGYWFGYLLPDHYMIYILAIVSGIFLHISTVIIFESSDNHILRFKKIIALISGFAIAYFTIGHHMH